MKKQMMSLILMTALIAGCATDRGMTQGQGATVGALGGAAAGAAIAAAATRGDSRAVLIGAGVGAVSGLIAGFMIGKHVADQKEKFASEEDYMDNVIKSAMVMNSSAQQYNLSLSQKVEEMDQEVEILTQRYNEKSVAKSTLKQEEKKIAGAQAEAENNLKKVNAEIEAQKRALAQIQVQSGERREILQAQIKELENNKTELEQHIIRISSIKTRVSV